MALVEIRGHHPAPSEPERPTGLDEHLAHFHRRVLTDALLEGTAAYWRRRARAFERVRTTECDQIALACHRKADLLVDIGLDAEAQAAIDTVVAVTAAENPVQEVAAWA